MDVEWLSIYGGLYDGALLMIQFSFHGLWLKNTKLPNTIMIQSGLMIKKWENAFN